MPTDKSSDALPGDMVKAFSRIEKRLEHEKIERIRAVEMAQEREELLLREIRRQRRTTILAIGITLAFTLTLGMAIWFTDGDLVGGTKRAMLKIGLLPSRPVLQSIDTKAASINCSDRQFKFTPYCQDLKARQLETWQGISRNEGGVFTLYDD